MHVRFDERGVKRSRRGLMRHRQTKKPETDRPVLNHRVTFRLYPFPDGTPSGTFIWSPTKVVVESMKFRS